MSNVVDLAQHRQAMQARRLIEAMAQLCPDYVPEPNHNDAPDEGDDGEPGPTAA